MKCVWGEGLRVGAQVRSGSCGRSVLCKEASEATAKRRRSEGRR